jgi:hypothetical protein
MLSLQDFQSRYDYSAQHIALQKWTGLGFQLRQMRLESLQPFYYVTA